MRMIYCIHADTWPLPHMHDFNLRASYMRSAILMAALHPARMTPVRSEWKGALLAPFSTAMSWCDWSRTV